VRGPAQRPNQIQNRIALIERSEQPRGLADFLEHDYKNTLVRYCIRHGQRNPLALFVDPQDNELAGQGLTCNLGGIKVKTLDSRREYLLLQNLGRNASSNGIVGEKTAAGREHPARGFRVASCWHPASDT
jgi:hypothetical protein